MPALVFLNRKWLIACDDFVIPCIFEAILRIIWCISTSSLIFLNISNCHESSVITYFLYALCAHLVLSSSLSVTLSVISAKGSVLEVEKRKNLSKFLYLKLLSVTCDIVVGSGGIWICTQIDDNCIIKEVFLKVTTSFAWIYVFIVVFGISVCYDSLGSAKYWNNEDNSNSLNFFKKIQYVWRTRLKLFCCCADISEENDFIYVEISTFLASFLNGVDLVPTDILAGIITISKKHALQRRKNGPFLIPGGYDLLEEIPASEWMTPENALYFLRIAKSTYGWLAFFSAFQPWSLCRLSSHAKCCMSCCHNPNDTRLDNCCHLNIAAVQKITGFKDSEILYGSFQNSIHEPAFYVAVDHQRRYIIVAVRGTRSFSDLLTDLDAENLPFGSNLYHRGTLRSALSLHKRLNELGVLETAFADYPSYTLALTGHSLGGSIAAALALMLRPRYPDLQCFSFGPLAMLSASGIPEALRCVMSVVVDVDMSPRLCAAACKELRLQIVEALKENQRPKYKILADATWYNAQKYLKCEVPRPAAEAYENPVSGDANVDITENTNITDDTKLYAPGRILYFERKNWSQPYWLTGLNLQSIIVHPDMISDHQPHRMQNMLELFIESRKDSRVTID